METQLKNYELAFHLTPDLETSEVEAKTEEIEKTVKKAGGNIIFVKSPVKTHLSYPLKKNHSAYFGHINFSVTPETIEKINSEMKLQASVLRYLISQKEMMEKRPVHETTLITSTHTPERNKTEKPSRKPEEIEKELEEVLEKI
ncbi:MAG: 30S ribosomal protein S6 [Candidatus Yanofskybacteria bacterium CG10_big_fil_rev_8_21_14_0_10_36_16]|uniref:Small ribosomal subunit protein bS6 n=1 Tax=Candidatus Yanofskybacteria bacterium CG10_big_fil_rev_8_21_14_0_10_36_16 TaxID=1975096 RepID=A0A2J0QC16_9BACT|nr:MAG: 30S ribosomal protein S6 [Candidatus Yanofskybacteria bacterium CG10_big_fil_rev_8_21_14_0_10_36_16]